MRTIVVNETEITCLEDGRIIKTDNRGGRTIKTLGTVNRGGYYVVSIGGRLMRTHRLIAEAFIDGFDSSMTVDHIDGNKLNNCACNLRQASLQDNQKSFQRKRRGATSTYRGVSWHAGNKSWRASCQRYGKSHLIGYFSCEVEAAKAWDRAAAESGYSAEAMNFNQQ